MSSLKYSSKPRYWKAPTLR